MSKPLYLEAFRNCITCKNQPIYKINHAWSHVHRTTIRTNMDSYTYICSVNLLPHLQPGVKGFLQQLATYTTFSMHHNFSASGVTLLHRHGMSALYHKAQHAGAGSNFGFAGNSSNFLHSCFMASASLSQLSADVVPIIARTRSKPKSSFAMVIASVLRFNSKPSPSAPD